MVHTSKHVQNLSCLGNKTLRAAQKGSVVFDTKIRFNISFIPSRMLQQISEPKGIVRFLFNGSWCTEGYNIKF